MNEAHPPSNPIRASLRPIARLHRFVLAYDDERRIAWMSDALTRYAGTGWVGREYAELLPDLDDCKLSDCEGAGVPDARLMASDGIRRVDVAALPQPAGAEGLSVFILRAVEERGLSNEETGPGGDFLAAILDNAPDAVLAVDRWGFIIYANPALKRLLGAHPLDIKDRPVAELLTGASDFGDIVANLDSCGSLNGDLKLGSRWLSISSQPLQLPDGRVAGSVSFLRDVTKRRAIQAQLEHTNAELESYVHSVSHDLRSPLVSLLGFSKLLRQDYESVLDETGRHFLHRIEQAGRTMEELIQDLLELARIESSRDGRVLVDPRSALLQLQAELKPRLDKHGIHLSLPDSPPLVLCDRTRLYQVFSNLIGNALDHMGPCEKPCIRVEVEARSDHHRICVRDNGVGIPAAEHERIFQIFQSLNPLASGRRTSGMGLAIVRKIAEVNGGRVWVDSQPDHGAAFYITLPR